MIPAGPDGLLLYNEIFAVATGEDVVVTGDIEQMDQMKKGKTW